MWNRSKARLVNLTRGVEFEATVKNPSPSTIYPVHNRDRSVGTQHVPGMHSMKGICTYYVDGRRRWGVVRMFHLPMRKSFMKAAVMRSVLSMIGMLHSGGENESLWLCLDTSLELKDQQCTSLSNLPKWIRAKRWILQWMDPQLYRKFWSITIGHVPSSSENSAAQTVTQPKETATARYSSAHNYQLTRILHSFSWSSWAAPMSSSKSFLHSFTSSLKLGFRSCTAQAN